MTPPPRLALTTTFYSYKGGAGRSVACANVAFQLSQSIPGTTIILDFDIESAGQGYIHAIEESRILGRGKHAQAIYLQEWLAGRRVVGDGAKTEIVDLSRKGEWERFAPDMLYDLDKKEGLNLQGLPEEIPKRLLVLGRPVGEVLPGGESDRQQGEVLRHLLYRLTKTLRASFVFFDSPSGTQPLAHLARNWSDVLIVLCRPSQQFLAGTRHFLHRLVDLLPSPQLEILVVLSAVPQHDDFQRQREQALKRLRDDVQEVNHLMRERGKPRVHVRIPSVTDEAESQKLTIPEVARLKWEDRVLTPDVVATEEEQSAVRAYQRLAQILKNIDRERAR